MDLEGVASCEIVGGAVRRKVSVFLPEDVLAIVDEVARTRLGIGRSAFLAVAALYLAAQFVVIQPRPKRRQNLSVFRNLMGDLQERLEKAL
jgi:metal-responsive CopG/Arc/MetJ family transcriptional regulator